eukprot:gene5434-3919_t
MDLNNLIRLRTRQKLTPRKGKRKQRKYARVSKWRRIVVK